MHGSDLSPHYQMSRPGCPGTHITLDTLNESDNLSQCALTKFLIGSKEQTCLNVQYYLLLFNLLLLSGSAFAYLFTPHDIGLDSACLLEISNSAVFSTRI